MFDGVNLPSNNLASILVSAAASPAPVRTLAPLLGRSNEPRCIIFNHGRSDGEISGRPLCSVRPSVRPPRRSVGRDGGRAETQLRTRRLCSQLRPLRRRACGRRERICFMRNYALPTPPSLPRFESTAHVASRITMSQWQCKRLPLLSVPPSRECLEEIEAGQLFVF